MKKISKILGIALMLLVLVISVSNIFAVKMPVNPGYDANNVTNNDVKTKANSIMGTFVFLVQIACVVTVISMGLRYMLTSAEGKANVKKDLVVWCIGAFIVFGATTLVGLVLNVTTGKQHVTISPETGGTSAGKHWASEEWEGLAKEDIIPDSIKDKLGDDVNITRGQFFELLYKMSVAENQTLNIAEDKKNVEYVDVEEGTFKDLVDKLYGSGIITGTGKTSDGKVNLAQNSDITREEIATVIYRYLGVTGDLDSSYSSSDCNAPDKAEIADYAKSSVYYLYNAKIIQGVDSQGTINPKGTTTCEEAVTILYRIYSGQE